MFFLPPCILRYLYHHVSAGITSSPGKSFHSPPRPGKIVVQRTRSLCHVAFLWCRHHQCHHSLHRAMFPGCSLPPHPWLNHPNRWSRARHPFSPLLNCASECRLIFASECPLCHECSTRRQRILAPDGVGRHMIEDLKKR